ncbi:MAG: ROK family protein [Candidatus Omnitrophota bacterium]
MSNDRAVRYFTTNDVGEDELKMLKVYGALKGEKTVSLGELERISGVSSDILIEKMKGLVKNKVVELSDVHGGGASFDVICREAEGKGFLGISFGKENCFLTVLDSCGSLSRKEKLPLQSLKTLRGRIGEIKDIIRTVSKTTTFRGIPLRSGGVVINSQMEGKERKGIALVVEGLSKVFKCDIALARRAAAAAYTEKKDNPAAVEKKKMLYFHTDSGEGVIVEGERIIESRAPGKGNESYLRAWDQFDAARIAIDLAEKGMGTDIVGMVKGDLGLVTIYEVLEASENGDELAEDLVKRSALALGVRAAYLANLFDIDVIVLGGGIERPGVKFREYMKESFDRFLLNEKKGKVDIVGGISDENVYSLGAALLSRREIFMEG